VNAEEEFLKNFSSRARRAARIGFIVAAVHACLILPLYLWTELFPEQGGVAGMVLPMLVGLINLPAYGLSQLADLSSPAAGVIVFVVFSTIQWFVLGCLFCIGWHRKQAWAARLANRKGEHCFLPSTKDSD